MRLNKNDINGALRIALTITVCMLIGKLANFNSPVYFALYPTILMTKGRQFSWSGIARMFFPTFIAASTALIVSNSFYNHPFIIWTISLFFFDFMRRRANTQAKLNQLLMPTFNWILIIIFAQHTDMNMPMRIHEILLAMIITAVVAKTMIWLFPVTKKKQPLTPMPTFTIGYKHRFVTLVLLGMSVAFLMVVNLISATFCLVPVIAAATQINRTNYIKTIKLRFITQVGGCMVALIFSIIMMGHQDIIPYYAFILGGLIFTLAMMMSTSKGPEQNIHADAILATVLPIQLYIGSNSLNLESTFLRGWELAVTLGILYLIHLLSLMKRV
ncbi:hypothetical protein CTM93_17170 [Photobacterium phosphoreum]|uniref:DUF2955 domain-containing protein n=1 Tax=Photobacterium phosphoreum TaxID=659 RepID=UPI000D184929|nr:DUF2955 domain-containing protein [Photobacterium phosphoreum]PSU80682.1 hypothetical protein CTM93_17170 [Photobacterium phosphoreum]